MHAPDPARTAIERQDLPGLQVITVTRQAAREIFVNAVPLPREAPAAALERAAAAVHERGGRVVAQDTFGIPFDDGRGLRPLAETLGAVRWPVTWLEPGRGGSQGVCGVQLWAVAGCEVEVIEHGGRVLGTLWQDDEARYCRMAGLVPGDVSAGRGQQAREVLELMERTLHGVGMDFHKVIRTWFHNEDILAWYDEFNRVRTAFFEKRGVFDRLVPASTGVGGRNPEGAALVSDLFAVEPLQDHVNTVPLPSPLQCPALEYGSSFSRAVELARAGHRWVLVSGTASIAPEGPTAHVGDIDGQIALTMDVVHAIFASRDMDWSDVTRGIAYFKEPELAPAFERYLAARGLPPLAVTPSHSTVCRDDLLFEIEIDAMRTA